MVVPLAYVLMQWFADGQRSQTVETIVSVPRNSSLLYTAKYLTNEYLCVDVPMPSRRLSAALAWVKANKRILRANKREAQKKSTNPQSLDRRSLRGEERAFENRRALMTSSRPARFVFFGARVDTSLRPRSSSLFGVCSRKRGGFWYRAAVAGSMMDDDRRAARTRVAAVVVVASSTARNYHVGRRWDAAARCIQRSWLMAATLRPWTLLPWPTRTTGAIEATGRIKRSSMPRWSSVVRLTLRQNTSPLISYRAASRVEFIFPADRHKI